MTKKRIDVMLDIETLGLDGDAPIIQIAAQAFDIKTGTLFDNKELNIFRPIEHVNDARGTSIAFWLNENAEKLKSYTVYELNKQNLTESFYSSESELIRRFIDYISYIEHSMSYVIGNVIYKPEVFLWGNGILFDNRLIANKCEKYKLKYPIGYRCNRDLKTVIDLAAEIKGLSYDDYYNMFTWEGCKHDALDDVKSQIKILCKAYDTIMNECAELD